MIRQLLTAPNQITLLRLIFIPLIILNIVDHDYRWALVLLVLAGLSDAFDGELARRLRQQTRLGQYLDPIADKLLLSSTFLVLSIVHQIPWKYTVLVFSRDLLILVTCAVIYATTSLRDFSPSIFGKINTFAQILTVFFVILYEVHGVLWVLICRRFGLYSTMAFTIVSGVHYVFLVSVRLREHERARSRALAS